MKTMKGWNESRQDLDTYLQIGDEVDEEMMWYFLEVLPPACYRANLIQIGEPYSHVGGRATFSTVYKPLGAKNWMYAGHCWRGEWEQPKLPKPPQPLTDTDRALAIVDRALAGELELERERR
jgi:hypothetical protein